MSIDSILLLAAGCSSQQPDTARRIRRSMHTSLTAWYILTHIRVMNDQQLSPPHRMYWCQATRSPSSLLAVPSNFQQRQFWVSNCKNSSRLQWNPHQHTRVQLFFVFISRTRRLECFLSSDSECSNSCSRLHTTIHVSERTTPIHAKTSLRLLFALHTHVMDNSQASALKLVHIRWTTGVHFFDGFFRELRKSTKSDF